MTTRVYSLPRPKFRDESFQWPFCVLFTDFNVAHYPSSAPPVAVHYFKGDIKTQSPSANQHFKEVNKFNVYEKNSRNS